MEHKKEYELIEESENPQSDILALTETKENVEDFQGTLLLVQNFIA